MLVPENRLFCRLDGLSQTVRNRNKSDALQALRLLEVESIPIFEEVVQMAAHFAQVPVAWLSVVDHNTECLKATFGLSRLGLMNDLVMRRSIDQDDSFGRYVTDSHQPLHILDTLAHPIFAQSLLTQQYGIRSYLGVPLVTSKGEYLGVLSVLDTVPRTFTVPQIEFLMLTARLGMSEYERSYYQHQAEDFALSIQESLTQPPQSLSPSIDRPPSQTRLPENTALAGVLDQAVVPLKFELLAQLTQELRTPLTSVMGMASVLTREIYGPLTLKQREYLTIIHRSGEYLLSLVKEILELSQLDMSQRVLNPTSVDIEMLCQQAIATLEQSAARREQQIRLTVEPGHRIWMLDKEKIRQMLYHLIFSIVQSSNGGSHVHLHVSNKNGALRLTVWVTHPCLDETLFGLGEVQPLRSGRSSGVAVMNSPMLSPEVGIHEALQHNMGFLLSRQLIELHGGHIQIQGESSPGYRYVITLPRIASKTPPQRSE